MHAARLPAPLPRNRALPWLAAGLLGLSGSGALAALPPPQPASATTPAFAPERLSHGRFRDITLYRPPGEARSVVLLLSGNGGWEQDLGSAARALAAQGALVAGIVTPALFSDLEASGDECVFPDGDLENLSHFIQGYAHLSTYHTPLLAGYASGATFAYAMLAQAPAATFAGALTLGFCPELELRKPLCKGEGVHARRRADGYTDLLPARQLSAPWVALQEAKDEACPVAMVRDFTGEVRGAALVTLPGTGHDPGTTAAWQPALLAAARALAVRAPAALPAVPADLDNLPLIEVPATPAGPRTGTFAVLLSGDGGWAGLDRQVAAALAARGIAVVGFDSLRYFWTPRTPQGLATDLDRIIDHYVARWSRPRVLLIGYSQGADVLPFALNRLPAATRAHVARTVLIGLGEQAAFEFHLANWVGKGHGGLPLLPEMTKLAATDVLCLYGEDEGESLCPKIPPGHVDAEVLPGGHHFDGAYDRLAARVLAGLPTGQ